MRPTLEVLDPLIPARRRLAVRLLLVGSGLAALAYWASSRVGLDPVDKNLLPVLAAGFFLGAVLLRYRPGTAPWFLPLVHGLLALYLLASLAYQLLLKPSPLGLSPAAYWVPFVYFSAFLFFPAQRALNLARLYLLLLFLLAVLGALRGHFQPAHLNALAQFFGANLAYTALLYLLTSLREGYREVQAEAHTDFLTGLPNRRYLDLLLPQELTRAKRYGRPLSLVLLDLDGFKAVNDLHGHEVGDRVLQALAQCLKAHLRRSDRAVRLGGEEFTLLLPETPLPQALRLAERLRQAVEVIAVPPVARITASFGVAEAGPTDTPLTLLRRADEAMYRAKRKGKNRVEAAPK
ncbi:GGDEF domain-containing protein [Thermus composti]|uniref:GGDEF domain-containing protein n=1 Tax=Thermus composti TaxID=532059 RepID=A0ABV6Q2C0_9DEIN|nr:GGDEF domain-containing protein [Thermus composti]GGM98546.1 GGDEF domain-containing protein [Thermus composti]